MILDGGVAQITQEEEDNGCLNFVDGGEMKFCFHGCRGVVLPSSTVVRLSFCDISG